MTDPFLLVNRGYSGKFSKPDLLVDLSISRVPLMSRSTDFTATKPGFPERSFGENDHFGNIIRGKYQNQNNQIQICRNKNQIYQQLIYPQIPFCVYFLR